MDDLCAYVQLAQVPLIDYSLFGRSGWQWIYLPNVLTAQVL